MKNLSMAAVAVTALLCATSCDKDDNTNPSTLSRIQAKWGLQSLQLDLPGAEGDETYTGVAADYIDFRKDNKVYSQIADEKDTMAYSLINDNTLVLDGDTAKISQLSNNQLIVTETYVAEGDTSKLIYNLKK